MSFLGDIIASSILTSGFDSVPSRSETSAYFSVPLDDRVALARRARTPDGERVHVIMEPSRKDRERGYAQINDVPVDYVTSVLEKTHGFERDQIEFYKR